MGLLEDNMAKYGIPEDSGKKKYLWQVAGWIQSQEKFFPTYMEMFIYPLTSQLTLSSWAQSVDQLKLSGYEIILGETEEILCFLSLKIINKTIPVFETFLLTF